MPKHSKNIYHSSILSSSVISLTTLQGTPQANTLAGMSFVTTLPERFSILDDPKYLGKYYGYFYSPKKTNQMIDSFSLELKKENGKTVARLSVDYRSIKNNGQIKIVNKVLEGTPILVKPSSIYIVLTEGTGQFNILSFSYVHYNLNNLYFRRGAMLTHGRDATRQPLMQSFVMFDYHQIINVPR